MQFKGKA